MSDNNSNLNAPVTTSPSLSQNVDRLLTDLQSSLTEYRDTVADAIVQELDIPANVAAIKQLVQKKLQAKHTPSYTENILELNFGSESLRGASQRILSLPLSTTFQLTGTSISTESKTPKLPMSNSIDSDSQNAELIAEQLIKNMKQSNS